VCSSDLRVDVVAAGSEKGEEEQWQQSDRLHGRAREAMIGS
jgi:hypothetical protein